MTTPSITRDQAIAAARSEVRHLWKLHWDIKDGIRPWSDWDESLTCTDRTQAAIEGSWEELWQARQHLTSLLGDDR